MFTWKLFRKFLKVFVVDMYLWCLAGCAVHARDPCRLPRPPSTGHSASPWSHVGETLLLTLHHIVFLLPVGSLTSHLGRLEFYDQVLHLSWTGQQPHCSVHFPRQVPLEPGNIFSPGSIPTRNWQGAFKISISFFLSLFFPTPHLVWC